MPKTITLELNDSMYDMFKKAADGQKRTIQNYIEYATLNYTVDTSIVSDSEMEEIYSADSGIQSGLADVNAGRYKVVG